MANKRKVALAIAIPTAIVAPFLLFRRQKGYEEPPTGVTLDSFRMLVDFADDSVTTEMGITNGTGAVLPGTDPSRNMLMLRLYNETAMQGLGPFFTGLFQQNPSDAYELPDVPVGTSKWGNKNQSDYGTRASPWLDLFLVPDEVCVMAVDFTHRNLGFPAAIHHPIRYFEGRLRDGVWQTWSPTDRRPIYYDEPSP